MAGKLELLFEVVRIENIDGMDRVELLLFNTKSNTHTTLTMDTDKAFEMNVVVGGTVEVAMAFSGRKH